MGFDTILLGFLSLTTLRDLIVKFNMISAETIKGNKILYNIFEPSYEKQILKKALSDLGFSEAEIKEVTRINKRFIEDLKKYDKPIELLVSLIINCIYKLSDECVLSGEPFKSNYYIHTMELVHNYSNLAKMAKIMNFLILNDKKRKQKEINFIIVPKGGNPLLARHIANQRDIDLLVLKGENEESSIKVNIDRYPKDFFKVNFEGGYTLLKKAENNPHKKLNGIVLDCNASSGGQVYNAIDTFNTMVDKNVINANHIEVAYVLFRPYDAKSAFDDEAININKYRLERYFDLNEDLKNKLYDFSSIGNGLDYIELSNKEIIDGFISMYLKDKIKFKLED